MGEREQATELVLDLEWLSAVFLLAQAKIVKELGMEGLGEAR